MPLENPSGLFGRAYTHGGRDAVPSDLEEGGLDAVTVTTWAHTFRSVGSTIYTDGEFTYTPNSKIAVLPGLRRGKDSCLVSDHQPVPLRTWLQPSPAEARGAVGVEGAGRPEPAPPANTPPAVDIRLRRIGDTIFAGCRHASVFTTISNALATSA